jgi:oligopeptide transport system ATP-binding protein
MTLPAAPVPSDHPDVVLSAREIVVHYPVRSSVLRRVTGQVHAVEGVSLELYRGETLAVVGESGCGKSTLSRILAGLRKPTSGTVVHRGQPLSALGPAELRKVRRHIQMIFQDPYASLNPRRTMRQIVQEAWEIHPGVLPRRQWAARIDELLKVVGLSPEHADRYPHQFSGGQQQRIGIARALALNPDILVCDEPVSALDVSVQGQIVALLGELQERLQLSYVFVSHNLALVQMIADRVAVMYLGTVVEQGGTAEVFTSPAHPYTQALLNAVPIPDPAIAKSRRRHILQGEIPSAENPPSGCVFRTRCDRATPVCSTLTPQPEPVGAGVATHLVACHHPTRP